ncbi:MAG TPA: ferritin-like domain-containing protein [Thermoleophilaceae bacterium]|nr:ferritin-like domain-containing protein [Thermoleophilaceae bacterium]
MSAPLTRRSVLGAAAAISLASCGGGDPPPGRAGPGSGAGLLGSLLAFERAVVAAYDACFELLRGDALRYAREIQLHDRDHARVLEDLIRGLGGTPPRGRRPEDYARQFPKLGSADDALRFAQDLEERQIRGYLEGLTDLPDPELRSGVAALAADEGVHLATVHLLRGQAAAQDPFVTGAL